MQQTMRAIAIDRFGGPEELRLQTVPLPEVGPHDVLIALEVAGLGSWDPFEREGGYAAMLGMTPQFPYVLGSEGAGVVTAVGEDVQRLAEGDRVYAAGFLNPAGGLYAEYAAVNADLVAPVPAGLSLEQAGVLAGAGITALRGLQDVLQLRSGESVLVFGASGGVGHIAVQLAKRMGARVLAVASGEDGVALARSLGADAAIDGRSEDVPASARAFSERGVDAALLTGGGEAAEAALGALRDGGRAAYPNGVQPEPAQRDRIDIVSYNGEPDRDILQRLNGLIAREAPGLPRFTVHIAATFPLHAAAEAHRALSEHYVGKLALRVREEAP